MVESLETEEIVTTYAYDNGGNLTHINGDEIFFYGNDQWRDQLTQYRDTPLTYDQIGNLTFDGTNIYTWQKGSQLAGINNNIRYEYDYTGLRSSKTVDTVKTDFVWVGGLLMAQVGGGNTIAWSYDGGGKMLGFTLKTNNTSIDYFYLRNLQGDVIGIYDSVGNVVVSYAYDAWGNLEAVTGPLAATLGELNPIRYRGYYWDAESGFYYCQSRFYNPAWCRWISADVYMDTADGILSTNMYAYCQNDPVNLADPDGFVAGNPALPIPFPGFDLDVLRQLKEIGKALGPAAIPLIIAGAKPLGLLAVGSLAAVGHAAMASTPSMERQLVELTRENLEDRRVLFFPALLKPETGGILVDLTRPMLASVAHQHVFAGGDVWTLQRRDAEEFAGSLGFDYRLPLKGTTEKRVRNGINSMHFHPAMPFRARLLIDGRSPHVFYGAQAVSF